MPTIADLSYTDNMSDNKKPFLTDIRETLDSIQDHLNDHVADNLVQLAKDCFGASYGFDSDGSAQFNSETLLNPQNDWNRSSGGDYTISTTGAWTDLDASNAKIAATGGYLGSPWRVNAHFTVQITSSNATNNGDIRWRLTDGSETSRNILNTRVVSGVSGSIHEIPVNLEHIFQSWNASTSYTVKLQYYIVTATAVTIKVLANTDAPLIMTVNRL